MGCGAGVDEMESIGIPYHWIECRTAPLPDEDIFDGYVGIGEPGMVVSQGGTTTGVQESELEQKCDHGGTDDMLACAAGRNIVEFEHYLVSKKTQYTPLMTIIPRMPIQLAVFEGGGSGTYPIFYDYVHFGSDKGNIKPDENTDAPDYFEFETKIVRFQTQVDEAVKTGSYKGKVEPADVGLAEFQGKIDSMRADGFRMVTMVPDQCEKNLTPSFLTGSSSFVYPVHPMIYPLL